MGVGRQKNQHSRNSHSAKQIGGSTGGIPKSTKDIQVIFVSTELRTKTEVTLGDSRGATSRRDVNKIISLRIGGPRTISRGPMQQRIVGAQFEITIDIAGWFPKSEKGNRYLLPVTDYFTQWPQVHATPDQQAPTVVNALENKFFYRFGVLRELHSDQGRNFERRLLQTRATPLHSQSYGMEERYVKTVQ